MRSILPSQAFFDELCLRCSDALRSRGFYPALHGGMYAEEVRELESEVCAPDHPLYDIPIFGVAKRYDDDIVVCDGSAYYLVHLTHSPEFESEFPTCTRFDTLESFLNKISAKE